MNKSLSCVIIDDEPLAVKLIESFVERTPDLEKMAAFTDSVEAVEYLRNNHPDLLFLDIQMPDINGMELAHMLPQETKIIFTTAFKEFAFESYEVSALDFLLKPIRYNKFLSAVEKAREWFKRSEAPEPVQLWNGFVSNEAQTIFLKVDGQLRQVAINDILYVSGMKDYVMFYLENEKRPLISHLTMKSVEDMLPQSLFMRVHRSYIVALGKIRSIDRNDCIYIGDEIIRVTEAVKENFTKYINSKFPGGK